MSCCLPHVAPAQVQCTAAVSFLSVTFCFTPCRALHLLCVNSRSNLFYLQPCICMMHMSAVYCVILLPSLFTQLSVCYILHIVWNMVHLCTSRWRTGTVYVLTLWGIVHSRCRGWRTGILYVLDHLGFIFFILACPAVFCMLYLHKCSVLQVSGMVV